jgi:hypothetical protein
MDTGNRDVGGMACTYKALLLKSFYNRQESCSSIDTSWCFQERHPEFESPIPQLLKPRAL